MIASEAVPWAKTGGLGDVVGALPAALAALGHEITLILPKYRGIRPQHATVVTHHVRQGAVDRHFAWHVQDVSPGWRIVFVESPEAFERPGLYGEQGVDYRDNAQRFDLLALAALEFAMRDFSSGDWGPPFDVVHAHDWQTSLVLARLASERRWGSLHEAGRVLTIHNLAYQGVFPRETIPALGLSWDLFRMESGEFWGQFSLLKSGITSADEVTTVSPTYADETRTRASGVGLDGVLRAKGDRYTGILNGIDTAVWDPATDAYLPVHFTIDDLSGKRFCKRALLEAFGLPCGDDALNRPLIGMVSRLVAQKGLDLIERASRDLFELDATYIFIGTGEPKYERLLRTMAAHRPTRVAVRIGFDERLAHLVEAGSDMFLMPSEFEPCGLNQMYSLRYGTVPIVRAVGGLHDTVQPYTSRALNANGFKFHHGAPEVLARTVQQAVRLYHNPDVWRKLVHNGMTADHSWRTSAGEYGKVYRRARAQGGSRQVTTGHDG